MPVRRALFALTTLFALLALAVPASAAQDLDCADFGSRADAQAHLDANPADPDRLDADNDRLACEQFDYPAAGGDPQPQPAEALPFTGPSALLAPLGLVLLSSGVGLVWYLRRRPQH
jgi:hypothetical protein